MAVRGPQPCRHCGKGLIVANIFDVIRDIKLEREGLSVGPTKWDHIDPAGACVTPEP